MYQDWESSAVQIGQLVEVCRDFFEARNFQIGLETKGVDKSVIRVKISPVGQTLTLVLERRGKMIRLSYLPLSHTQDALARLGGLLVTGQIVKTEAQKQAFLDQLEQQFWENLDQRLAGLDAFTRATSSDCP